MKILVYSYYNAKTIAGSMGLPDYSYYFVLKDFLPVLRELGEVIVVEREQDIQSACQQAVDSGQPSLFLSFTPPHKTPLGLPCTTLPVFAWEFSSIPNEHWQNDKRQNWCLVLQELGAAITHSGQIVQAVRRELGDDFPIISVPSPVWDKYAQLRRCERNPLTPATLHLSSGVVIDSHDPRLWPYIAGEDCVALAVQEQRERKSQRLFDEGAQAASIDRLSHESALQVSKRHLRSYWTELCDALSLKDPLDKPLPSRDEPRLPVWKNRRCSLQLEGVVFTSLFNPYDGRKNWADMLTAFCSAFRHTPDATLVFKLGHREYLSAVHDMLIWMARMPRFECRVVLLQGYLEGESFEQLIRSTSFVVNAAYGEGQCLPLMEFMSCGVPAVAPCHSGMADYMDEQVGFVVNSWEDGTAWCHDPRLAYRTLRHQIDWASLRDAYQAAYRCIKERPADYARLSEAAIERMSGHCSREVAKQRLGKLFNDLVHKEPA
ncbi:glycosyltransferase [Pseudomonas fluvialis]|uniref:glycosyltransferase n=1 Tax=Pseudomonas fluvialis TaxID=1793966 RepID=UPI0035B02787